MEHDFNEVVKKFEALSSEFEDYKESHRKIEKGINRILYILEDDSKIGREGLPTRMNNLETKQRNLERDFSNKLAEKRGRKSVYVLIGSFIGFILTNADDLWEWIKHLFQKN